VKQAGQKSQNDENVSNDSQGLDQFTDFHSHKLTQVRAIFNWRAGGNHLHCGPPPAFTASL